MSLPENRTAGLTAIFIFLAGISGAGLLIPRVVGSTLLISYFVAFFGYFWLSRGRLNIQLLISTGLFARLILFLKMPELSDDIYRFIWDGNLLQNGINPYIHLPENIRNQGLAGIDTELFVQLNSPNYYSVYPPFNQALFWLATYISESQLAQTNILRSVLLIADIGSLYFLGQIVKKNQLNANLPYWFFLNPLHILEVTGNMHFEGLVIFFLIVGIYYFDNSCIKSGLGFGLAIATKILPLIFIPTVFFRNTRTRGFKIVLIAGIISGLTFLPFLFSEAFTSMNSSLGLYFQKFEFNASIYFLLRKIGFWVKGYNIIGTLGPWLSLASFLAIVTISFVGNRRGWHLSKTMLFALSAYLLFTTTVHPWYILPLIPLGLLSGFYYPLVWSLMVFITYLGYSKEGFELSLGWIALEYVTVILTFSVELFKKYETR